MQDTGARGPLNQNDDTKNAWNKLRAISLMR